MRSTSTHLAISTARDAGFAVGPQCPDEVASSTCLATDRRALMRAAYLRCLACVGTMLAIALPSAASAALPDGAPGCGVIPDDIGGGFSVPEKPFISEPFSYPDPEPPGRVHIKYSTSASIPGGERTDLGVLVKIMRNGVVLARREAAVDLSSDDQTLTWKAPARKATYVVRVEHIIEYTSPDGSQAVCSSSAVERFKVDAAVAKRKAKLPRVLDVEVEKDLARGLIRWNVQYEFAAGDLPCLIRDQKSAMCDRWHDSTIDVGVTLLRGREVVSRDDAVGVVHLGSGSVSLFIPYPALPRGRYSWSVTAENPLNFSLARRTGTVSVP